MNADRSQNLQANLHSEDQPSQTSEKGQQNRLEISSEILQEVISKANQLNRYLKQKLVLRNCLRIPSENRYFIDENGKIVRQVPDFDRYGWGSEERADEMHPMVPVDSFKIQNYINSQDVQSFIIGMYEFLNTVNLLKEEEIQECKEIAENTSFDSKRKFENSFDGIFYAYSTSEVFNFQLNYLIRKIRIFLKSKNDSSEYLLPDVDSGRGELFKLLINYDIRRDKGGISLEQTILSLGLNDGLIYIAKNGESKFASISEINHVLERRSLSLESALLLIAERIIWDLIPIESPLYKFKPFLITGNYMPSLSSSLMERIAFEHPLKES